MSSSKKTPSDKEHDVIINLSIVQAVQSPRRDPPYYETTRNGKRKRVYESVRPVHNFHLEYQLTPSSQRQGGPTVYSTDVVTYNIVSKIFTEQDERVVNVWKEDGLTYYGWNHKHHLKVNLDTLLDLYDHTITVRLWNTSDKLAPRARFDRPKAFRLPAPSKHHTVMEHDESQDSDGLYSIGRRPTHLPNVHHDAIQRKRSRRRRSSQIQILDSLNDVASLGQRALTTTIEEEGNTEEGAGLINKGMEQTTGSKESEQFIIGAESIEQVTSKDDGSKDTLSLSAPESSLKNLKMDTTSSQIQLSFESLSASVSKFRGLSKKKVRQLQADAAENVRIDREGLIVLTLSFADLFTGRDTVKTSIKQGIRNIKQFEVCLSLATPLMSEAQRRRLNPAEFIVRDISNLPLLENGEKPIYMKYQFYDKAAVSTPSVVPVTSTTEWSHSKVILLGTITNELLLEYLRGPPLAIEVHNDGREPSEEVVGGGAVFGSLWSDPLIGTCTYTREVKKKSHPKYNMFGVAYLDLGTFLDGLKTMEYCLPILREHVNYSGSSMKSHELLRQGCHVTVKVTLSYPLDYFTAIADSTVPLSSLRPLTPFGRIIFIVKSNLIDRLLSIIKEINIKALNLETLPQESQNLALSTYKLTKEEITSPSCNVITGFHIDNGDTHYLVCEGLADNGIQHLWDHTPHHPTQDPDVVKVLYNSEYTFSFRLYGNLDVDLSYIKLPQPLATVLRQPLIYLQDSIPKLCFNSLMKLNELLICPGVSDVIRTDCLPSAMMITALNLYCMQQEHQNPTISLDSNKDSLCVSDGDKLLDNDLLLNNDAVAMTSRGRWRRRRSTWEPLDRTNPRYEEILKARLNETAKDFIKENIVSSHLQSNEVSKVRKNRLNKLHFRSLSEEHGKDGHGSIHPYSCQTYNSSVLGRELLRSQLDPKSRYTHSQNYHNRTVEPPSVPPAPLGKDISSHKFKYPVMKTSLENNAPSKRPHESRIQELQEPFIDNTLHRNKLKPTLNWEQFKWEERNLDFDRYRPCPLDFGVQQPATIHFAGDTRDKEIEEYSHEEYLKWKAKVVVDDEQFHVLRRNVQTESAIAGPLASTQIEKLEGLLKDEPARLSLRLSESLRVDNLPALSTVHTSDEQHAGIIGFIPADTSSNSRGASKPCRSLKRNSNTIPLYKPTKLPGNLHRRDFELYCNDTARKQIQHEVAAPDGGEGKEDLYTTATVAVGSN